MVSPTRGQKPYLKSVFVDRSRLALTCLDALCVLVLVFPRLAGFLSTDAQLVRSVAVVVLLTSLGLATVAVYRRRSEESVSEDSIAFDTGPTLLACRTAQVRYLGPEAAKDVEISISYTDPDGRRHKSYVQELFAPTDLLLEQPLLQGSILQPGDSVTFRLPLRELTTDAFATVEVRLVGATSGRKVRARKLFGLSK